MTTNFWLFWAFHELSWGMVFSLAFKNPIKGASYLAVKAFWPIYDVVSRASAQTKTNHSMNKGRWNQAIKWPFLSFHFVCSCLFPWKAVRWENRSQFDTGSDGRWASFLCLGGMSRDSNIHWRTTHYESLSRCLYIAQPNINRYCRKKVI